MPGTDHAGIATQLQVERKLRNEGTSREAIGRERFLEESWDWKDKHHGGIVGQLRRLGASCDWERERFTMDEGLNRAVNEAFVRLYRMGLIYQGEYIVNWSPGLQTAVSDVEVEYTEEQGMLYYFKYPIAGAGLDEGPGVGYIPVATTRPETILGDTAVAVHPDDERYRHLIGTTCLVPMLNRTIPVIHDTYVDMAFGTGALKITPGHDPNDFEIGRRHGLQVINIMNRDATLNDEAGPYAGMERFAARKQLWADMAAPDLTIRRTVHDAGAARPARRRDHRAAGEQPMVPEHRPHGPDGPGGGALRPHHHRARTLHQGLLPLAGEPAAVVHQPPTLVGSPHPGLVWTGWARVCGPVRGRGPGAAASHYGRPVPLEQDPDVLDTWFSSGLWPFSTLGWPDDTPDLRRFYPTDVLETGYDIIFFWVARMIMRGCSSPTTSPSTPSTCTAWCATSRAAKCPRPMTTSSTPLRSWTTSAPTRCVLPCLPVPRPATT